MLAALRRLTFLVALASVLTTVASVLLGLLVGASLDRSVALGFYGLGCFLMVSGFFVGNRGPARVKSETAHPSMLPLPGFGSRRLRWATPEEQYETMSNSAVFIVLGLILVLIGVAVDTRQSLV
jgi:Na+/melibiose symporter-like transporter